MLNLRQSQELKKLRALVRADLDRVEETLQSVLGSSQGLASDVSTHVLSSPGKRLRPILVLLTSRLGPRSRDLAITAAAAVELIHTATLVHDDTIDESALRRGKATVNDRWGDKVSLIFGDYLYSRSFMLMAEAGLFDAMRILASATHMMTHGELLQVERQGRLDVSEEEYLWIVRCKTASLFSAACQVGFAACVHGDGWGHRVVDFGERLGVAYQMLDDLLDFIGAERSLGKPVGSDLREGRTTLPLISALRGASESERAEIISLINNGGLENGGWPEVVSFVSRHGGIDYCRRKVKEYGEAAKRALGGIEFSEARDALLVIADYVVDMRE